MRLYGFIKKCIKFVILTAAYIKLWNKNLNFEWCLALFAYLNSCANDAASYQSKLLGIDPSKGFNPGKNIERLNH